MAKFIKKVLLFFALIAIIDVACGFGFKYLRAHAKSGDTQKNYYISEKCCEDILILGSSRAARHYDPKVVEEAFGLSCYNAGEPGCGIITAYARYRLIVTRKRPKVVIYEVSPRFDYFKGDDNSKYLGRVRQYADKPDIKAMFLDLGDILSRLRLMSNMYKNNSFIVHNVMDNLSGSKDNKGFKPLLGEMKKGTKYKPNRQQEPEIDSVKLSYLEKLIVELKQQNMKIFFVVSPKGINQNEASLETAQYGPIINLCQKYGIPFINHTFMAGISDHRQYFHDIQHLNREGAIIYTEAVCKELKDLLIQ